MPHQSSHSHSWEFRLPWLGRVSSTSTAKEGGKAWLWKLAKQSLLLQSLLSLPVFPFLSLIIMYLHVIGPFCLGLRLPKHFKKFCLKLFPFSGNSVEKFQATMPFAIPFWRLRWLFLCLLKCQKIPAAKLQKSGYQVELAGVFINSWSPGGKLTNTYTF